MNSIIICYVAIFLEAVLIVFMLAKIYDAYSQIEILSSLTNELRDDYIRVLDSWKKSIDNTNDMINVARNIIDMNEELSMRLNDSEEKKNER